MSSDPVTTFDDFEDEGPDDSEALAQYAAELKAACQAFDVPAPGGPAR